MTTAAPVSPPVTTPNPPATPPAGTPTPPAWLGTWKGEAIPDKFHRATIEETLAEVSKAHREAEKLIGSTRPNPAAANTPEALQINQPGPETAETLGAMATIQKAGLDAAELAEQFKTKGELTPDQYAALRRVNPALGKSLANDIATGLVARQALEQQTVANVTAEATAIAGGEPQLAALRTWAASNMDAELKALNEALKTQPSLYPTFIGRIKAKYEAHPDVKASGSQPLITGTPAGGGGPATSSKEYLALLKSAQAGDKAAQARVRATPTEKIMAWG